MNGHWSNRPLMATEPYGWIRLHCRMTIADAVWPATTVNGAEPIQVWLGIVPIAVIETMYDPGARPLTSAVAGVVPAAETSITMIGVMPLPLMVSWPVWRLRHRAEPARGPLSRCRPWWSFWSS